MVNIRALLYVLGALFIFLAIAMLFPAAISIIYSEDDLTSILTSSAISALLGIILVVLFRIKIDLKIKDGFALVTLSWLAFALIGALPFYISGYIPSYTDAFFETMSGFTTTGATILTDIEILPHGLLFWRSFTHWLGGMGIILLSLAILPLLGVGGMQLYKAEVPGPEHDRLTPRIKNTAVILWEVYALISVVEAVLLYFAGMDVFDAVCHTFGTMATGGFSTKNASIGYYNSPMIDTIIIVFMLIAGINFFLHFRAIQGKVNGYFKDSEVRFFLGFVGFGTLVVFLNLVFTPDYSVFESMQKGMFQVVSIITTTGYGTDDYELWGTSAQVILFLLMFIGGCAGSTGGGMKIIRTVVMFKFGVNEIKRLIHPQAVLPVRINKKSIPNEIIANIAGFFMLYITIFIFGVIVMSFQNMDFLSSIGCVAATIGNIGPGLGSVGPTDNYAHINDFGKWFLSFLMLAGRLEIYTVIILLTPIFWKK